jgi:ComEC/Rec2-related protein
LRYYHLLWALSAYAGVLFCSILLDHKEQITTLLKSAALNLPAFYFIAPSLSMFLAIFAFFLMCLHSGKVSVKNFRCKSFSLLKASVALSCIALFFAGWLSYFSMDMSNESRLFELLQDAKKPAERYMLTAEGRIMQHIKRAPDGVGFLFEINKITIQDSISKTRKTQSISDKIYVKVLTEESLFLSRDDFISFNFIPVQKGNYKYLSTYEENILSIDGPLSGLNEKIKFSACSIRQRFYRCISGIFYKSLKYEHAALCEALILGNRNNLSSYIIDNFKKSGIYHLLAISGMHISFFIIIIFSLLQLIFRCFLVNGYRNAKTGNILIFAIIIIIVLYNFITGTKASVMRASVMSVFVFYARHLGRDHSNKYLLSICFIILLIINPSFFSDLGFWLSFASVFAIIYTNGIYKSMFSNLNRKFNKRLIAGAKTGKRQPNYFSELAISTISVNIFIFPLLFFFFGEFSFLSLPVNMAVVPVFYCLLFILILSSIAGLFWPPAGVAIIKAVKPVIIIILKISEQYKRVDFLIIDSPDLSSWYIVLYYFCLGAVLTLFYIADIRRKKNLP